MTNKVSLQKTQVYFGSSFGNRLSQRADKIAESSFLRALEVVKRPKWTKSNPTMLGTARALLLTAKGGLLTLASVIASKI